MGGLTPQGGVRCAGRLGGRQEGGGREAGGQRLQQNTASRARNTEAPRPSPLAAPLQPRRPPQKPRAERNSVGRLKRPMAEMCVKAVLSVADLERRDVNLDLIKARAGPPPV